MQIFRKMAEKRERDEREARILVRRHGDHALIILEDRIATSADARAKGHWKKVHKLARGYLRQGLPMLGEEQPA